ncbi:hypothetical protein ACQRD6_12075 [Prevotella sp. SGI.027]|nr:hypothetical protein [Prevotella sp.]
MNRQNGEWLFVCLWLIHFLLSNKVFIAYRRAACTLQMFSRSTYSFNADDPCEAAYTVDFELS